MKKRLLTFLFICAFIGVYAQVNEQVKLPTSNKIYFNEECHWIYYCMNSLNNSFIYKDYYNLKGDTIINDTQYRRLYNNADYIGAIREINGKVYAYNLAYPPLDEEILLYDFNLEKGDIFVSNAPEGELSSPMEVIGIENITFLNGENRKIIHFNTGTWIEGIGDTRGILSQTYWHTTNGNISQLVCFKQNNEILFNNEILCERYEDINCCEINGLGVSAITDLSKEFKMRNNGNYLNLDFTENKKNTKDIKLLDLDGSITFQTSTKEDHIAIDVSSYNLNDIFLIWIQTEGKIITIKYLKNNYE